MEVHHQVWLEAHKNRSEEWLKERLKDGFDIHHIDGNHENNDPANLVLIEHGDHMMLHGKPIGWMGRISINEIKTKFKRKPEPRHVVLDDGRRVRLFPGEMKKVIKRQIELMDGYIDPVRSMDDNVVSIQAKRDRAIAALAKEAA